MDCGLKYAWQEVVLDAFLAAPGDLAGKINVAERTISTRISESDVDFAERMALDDALRMLRVLIFEARLQQAAYKQDEKQSSPVSDRPFLPPAGRGPRNGPGIADKL